MSTNNRKRATYLSESKWSEHLKEKFDKNLFKTETNSLV